MQLKNSRIIENVNLIENIYRLKVKFDKNILPGQFFMLKTLNNEYLLPRPISVNDYDGKEVTFLYRLNGNGTRVISKLDKGDEIQVLGPLGNGFDVNKINGKVAIIGGGIGVAPLLYLTRKLKCNVDIFLGFKDIVYIVDEFKKYSNNVCISTEDGSKGYKGYIIDQIKFEKYDTVITCGPEIMMNIIMDKCIDKNIGCFVSLEKRMACGIGACLGCSLETIHGMKRVCKDGPIFEATELVR